MKRTLYIPFTVCILLFPACSGDLPEQQAGESCVLQLNFKQEGEATLVRNSNALTTENGEIKEIGLCITQGKEYASYPGRNGTRYTFKTNDKKLYEGEGKEEGDGSSSTSTTFYLTGENAHIQAFYPNSAVTKTNSDNGYTIPVEIPAEQTFTTTDGTSAPSTPRCVANDYLYGSASNNVGDATSIITNAMQASPTNIYLHHALAKVMFTLQCDANRTPNTEYDCVKSIEISASSGDHFLIGATGNPGTSCTMQINNGTLTGLTETDKITLKPQGDPIAIGKSGNPATVACGLVAPLDNAPTNDVTLTITLGKGGDTAYDRTYTATAPAFKQKWEAGYCYTYKLVLGNTLTVDQVTTSWASTSETDIPAVTPKERGISDANELMAFATLWNKNGLKTNADGVLDYSPYEPYGWYEKDSEGKTTFSIKLTKSFTVEKETGKDWIPIGIEDKPLLIPFDGQGWQITFDLNSGKQAISNSYVYAGVIGYTKADIRNVRIAAGNANNTDNAYLESTDATCTGVLVGKSEADITNCSIELRGITMKAGNTASSTSEASSTSDAKYLGGLAGYCTGNISNCAVYQTAGTQGQVWLENATAGSSIGALVGKTTGNVSNCYTYIHALTNSRSDSETPASVTAGWIAGAKETTLAYSNCHFISGGTAPDGTSGEETGITQQTSLTGLCTSLNAEVDKHPHWTLWTERKGEAGTGTETVTSVYLFDYRN